MPLPPPSLPPFSSTKPQAASTSHAGAGRRVLLAGVGEREKDLAATLAREGFLCDQVADGALAIAAVTESGKQYAAVLMAPAMPVLDGLAAVAVLRAIGFGGPVLALTVAGVDDGAAAVAGQRRAGFSASVAANAAAAALAAALRQPTRLQPSDTGFEDLPAFGRFRHSFQAALGQRVAQLSSAAGAADWAALAHQAHNLKGSGGTFGFPEISRFATEVELAARAADGDAAGAAIERLRAHAALLDGAAPPHAD